PSTSGQSVTVTGTVIAASGSGTPSGTLQFKDGSTNLGSRQTLNGSGQASVSTSSLTQGGHSITAVYSGDSTFSGSTSPAMSQTVNGPPATTTAVSSSQNPSAPGQSVTFTATVTKQSGTGTP